VVSVAEEDSVVETDLKEEKDVASAADVGGVTEATEEAVVVGTVVVLQEAVEAKMRGHGYP